LKVLPSALTGSIAARDRFQREARRATKVHSENVVQVLDFGDSSGTRYLALELVEGPTLAEYVQKNGTLDGEVERHVLIQAARAALAQQMEGEPPVEEEAPPARKVPAAKKPVRRSKDEEDEERVTTKPAPVRGQDTNDEDEGEAMPTRKPRSARAGAGIPKQ